MNNEKERDAWALSFYIKTCRIFFILLMKFGLRFKLAGYLTKGFARMSVVYGSRQGATKDRENFLFVSRGDILKKELLLNKIQR
jgi:hypothetical protein